LTACIANIYLFLLKFNTDIVCSIPGIYDETISTIGSL